MAAKKKTKRTAKQKAATKKLIAFNKKRRGKKSPKGRTKARRKNPARPSSKKSHLWVVFKCDGNNVKFMHFGAGLDVNWSADKGRAILFKTKEAAGKVARTIGGKRGYAKYQLGAAAYVSTLDQIRKACNPKK